MSALTTSSAPSRQTRSTVPEQCYASGLHRLIGKPIGGRDKEVEGPLTVALVEKKNMFESSEQITCPHTEKCRVKLDIGLVVDVKQSFILKHYRCSGH